MDTKNEPDADFFSKIKLVLVLTTSTCNIKNYYEQDYILLYILIIKIY